MIEVLSPGALSTIQDRGRIGFSAKGYPVCGAADQYAMQVANILAGNGVDSSCAVLECTFIGATLRFQHATLIGLAGAEMKATLDGTPIQMLQPVLVQAGQILTLGTAGNGLRSVLAVHGGFDVPEVMGSRSTDLKCHIGGVEGRALQKGDLLSLFATEKQQKACAKQLAKSAKKNHFTALELAIFATPLHPWRVQGQKRVPLLRAVLGPQEEYFTQGGIDTFVREFYTLTADSNRMACKMKGNPIETVAGSDILSDGIVEGSIQVAADGNPIVMLADHQTTGGYAKIATVISTDVAVLAQLRPSDSVAFRVVTPHEAVMIARAEHKRLEWIAEQFA